MKTKIKEVNDYFKNKMLLKEFNILKVNEYTMEILIDNEYNFIIWIGNLNIPESIKCYDLALSFMDINFNKEESLKFNNILRPEIIKFRKEVLINRKIEELKQLQNELNNMS
jgi:hypothetical protein